MTIPKRSPWERALDAQIAQLDPRLRAYFSAIPEGSVGRGSGTFSVVGTPKRWLWPMLSLLEFDDVMFPVWERNVRFTVTNRSTANGTVRARRVFHFARGDRTMTDEVGITRAGLVDRLGRSGIVSVVLRADVVDGALVLTSTAAALRLGRIRIPLGVLSPRVRLTERGLGNEQAVSLRLEAPLVGLIYEYAGTFTYRVAREA